NAAVRVAPFVVVPAYELEESLVELDTGARVKNARMGIVNEVRGHDFVTGVSQDALEIGFTGFFERRADLFVTGFLDRSHRQIDDGNRGRGHAKGHAGELALDLGNGQSYRTGRSCSGGDDVDRRRSSPFPVLLGGPID